MTELEQFLFQLNYLGYNTKIDQLYIGKAYEPLCKLINSIPTTNYASLKPITLEEIKTNAINFYEKYFSIHDIYFGTPEQISKIPENSKTELEAYKKYYELVKKINPFDLPIKLINGNSMVGEIKKPLLMTTKENIPEEIGTLVPFSHIELGKELTKLSAATYVHEIGHSQLESNPGCVENFLNKEVITIFLEKLSALELDPTGNLLKVSERIRFLEIAAELEYLNKPHNLSIKDRYECMMYIQSTLLAEKLFDMYLQEKKLKNKDKYIYDIQTVFDGKQTVEDIIRKRDITLAQGRDLTLVRRHI